MVAYVICERLKAWDPGVFDAYGPLAAASIARFGGRYLAKGEETLTLEGEGPAPLAMALLEFPDLESAKAWYASQDYQAAARIRRGGAQNRFVALEAPGS